MDIAEIHERINFLTDRERGEYFDPEDIDRTLDIAQLRELQKYFGDDRAVQQGNLGLMFRQMQHIDDAVNQFKGSETTVVAAPATTGQVDMTDYLYITGVSFNPTDATKRSKEVPVVSKQEWYNRTESALFSHLPCAYLASGLLEVYVPEGGAILAHGITRPVEPNITTPTDLNWGDDKQVDIIYVALQMLGLNAADRKAIEFGINKSNPQT